MLCCAVVIGGFVKNSTGRHRGSDDIAGMLMIVGWVGAVATSFSIRPAYERQMSSPLLEASEEAREQLSETSFPHATEAVWTLAEDRSVYVVEHPDGAGNSVVTMLLDDLDAHVAAIAARGLEPDERETYSNGVRKALYRDPDGNELGFGGAPLGTGS